MSRRWNNAKRALTGALAALAISCGGDGGVTEPPAPTPDTTAPTGQLSGPQTGETTRELDFTLTADDNNALENAEIDWQDGNNTTIELDGTQAQEPLTHTYNKAGKYTPTLTLADTAGNTTTLNAEPVRVDWRTMNLDLDAKTFFSQEPHNNDVTVRIQNETSGQDTTLTGAGGVTGTVHYGNVSLTIDTDGHTEVHRLFVDETPKMTAYEDTPITLEPRDELRATIETVDDISYLEDMASQWTARPVTMRVGETQYFVLYKGYEACDFEHITEAGLPAGMECADDKYRGGVPIDEEFRQGFYAFSDAFQRILANPRIGWEPYDIEVVEADTSQIGEYLDNHGRTGHNVMLTSRRGWPHHEFKMRSTLPSGVEVLARSAIGVHSGSKSSYFSNEFTHHGSRNESNPSICSVRDDERYELEECPVFSETTIFYEADRNNTLLAAAYVAAAQLQGYRPLILPPDHLMVESSPAGAPSLAPGEMQLELDAPLGYERAGRLYVPEGTTAPTSVGSVQGGLEQAVVDGLAGEDVHVTFEQPETMRMYERR